MKKIIFSLIIIFLNVSFAQEILKIDLLQDHLKIHSGNELKLLLKVKLNPEWHINSNKPNEDYLIPSDVRLSSSDGFLLSEKIFPQGKNLSFDFSDVPVSVYEGEFNVLLKVKVPENLNPGNYTFDVFFKYQACNNQTCIAPKEEKLSVSIEVINKNLSVERINSKEFTEAQENLTIKPIQENSVDSIFSGSLFLSFILIFAGGLALNLTPCVYPLIPITLGYFGGQSESKTSKLFLLSVLYVLGMAITYSLIGVITALSGSMFGALLQNPLVLIGIALVLVSLSLSMFGLYEFQLPASWMAKFGAARSGYFGALFMGLTMGIVAAPCIGPFVVGLLTFVGAKGDPIFGFFVFFVLALGLGFPYIFLGVFSGKIKSLPRSGEWMIGVKKLFGFILIGMAIYFLLPLIPVAIRGVVLPSYMILSALYLLIFDKIGENIKVYRFTKFAILFVVIIVGLWLLIPSQKESIKWEKVNDDQIILLNGKPTIIDFFADWCVPCKELDAMTFTNPAVIAESKRFNRYKVDLTKLGNESTKKVIKKYGIVGVPTIILYNSKGEEVKRITSFIDKKEFLEIMKTVE